MTSRKILRARKSEMNNRKASHRKRLPERPIFELTPLERRVLLSGITNYSYSFEAGTSTTGWFPIATATSNAITGWGSTTYLEGPSTLTLNQLPVHTGAVVSFDIYALDEWDGNNSPTAFTLKANGATVVNTNFANTWDTGTVTNNDPDPPTTEIDSTCYTQSYPAANENATLAPQTGAWATGDMDSDGELLTGYSCTSCTCGGGCGCGCCGGGGTTTWTVTPIYGGNISDAVYQFNVPIDDSSSTLVLDFGATLPVGAKMGIDNVNVTLAQPEVLGGTSDGNGVDLFTGSMTVGVPGPSDASPGTSNPNDLTYEISSDSPLTNSDAGNADGGVLGNQTIDSSTTSILEAGPATIALDSGGSLKWFDSIGGTWTERYGGTDKLTYDSTNAQYILTDASGNQTIFYDFNQGGLAGKIKSSTDPDGNTVDYNYNGSDQMIQMVGSRTTGTVTTKESFAYSYLTSPDPNAGKVASITWQTKTYDTSLGQSDSSVSYSTVKETFYTYYTSGDSGGSQGDLEMAQTKDPSGNVIDSAFYRYYISGDSDTHGYVGALKYEFGTAAYARLVESLPSGTTPATARDAQVAPYADHYYQYNSNHMVTEDVVGGAGGDSSGGQGTDSLSYTDSGNATGYNYWSRKTTETLPDGTTQYHYFNAYGEEILSITKDASGNLWGTFTEYDNEGRVILAGNPSAVNIPSLSTIEQYPDLLNDSSGHYEYLNGSSGLITTTSYYGSTTATSTTAGSAAGFVSATYIQNGETGTPIEQESWQYYEFSAGSATTYPVATDTTYGNTNGTDTRTTSYGYSLYSGTVQPKLETVTVPTISSSQNGPNTTDAQSTFYDTYGRPIWTKDADGHVNYTAYDMATGATIQTITDVVYATLTSDQKSSFDLTGWTDPTGGLNLVTNYEVDDQGRTIKEVSPQGNVTYTVYNDANHETRLYSGWQSTTGTATAAGSTTTLICSTLGGASGAYVGQTLLITGGTDSGQSTVITGYDASTHTLTFSPAFTSATSSSSTFAMASATGPIQISREYDAGADTADFSYDETLTTSAAATIDSTGAPTGQETIDSSNIASLSRQFMNAAGQVAWSDVYFNLSGITYSQAVGADGSGNPADLGTAGTNYYRTSTLFDSAGRANRVVSPSGTITRTVFDALGRVISKWEGTNDTPASGTWSPTNNGGSSNMIDIEDDQYDGGGVGDSNLTQVTKHPGDSQPDRVTQYLYDWRDRQVVEKEGVQSSESDGTHRPVTYTVYDNLGEVIESDGYDGDGVTLSSLGSTAGVPNAPSSSLLRAKTITSYDDQGRVYRTQQYDVNQSSGAVSTNVLTTNTFYDLRGDTIAEFDPDGQVTKSAYDGAGRLTTQYTTDGGALNNGGTPRVDWTDAASVCCDVMLTQTEYTYDEDGNTIFTVTRDRFDNDSGTATGALGTPTTGVEARVSYSASYYDAAGRGTDEVDLGTNGGSAYTRPSSVPSRSDTVLVTHTLYDAAGNVLETIDPRGLITQFAYDLLGRKTQEIDDSTGGSPATGMNVTNYTYNGDNDILTMTAYQPNGTTSPSQVTAYVYGVGGTAGTNLFSNDLLKEVEYPDPTTGCASCATGNFVDYTYDLLGEQMTMTDRNATVHAYSYDVLGRQTSDAITHFGTGVDTVMNQLSYSYNALGLLYQETTGNVGNQLQFAYNGLGQLTNEYESVNGAVNTSTTPDVQYVYNEMAGGENNSRLRSIIYPNGRIVDYDYSPNQQPVTSLSSSGTTVTVDTASSLGISTGDTIVIEGAGAPYDGTFTVTSVSTNTFTYSLSASHTGSSSGTDITAAKLSLDGVISRVDGEQDHGGSDAGTVLQSYTYLGLDTIVQEVDSNGMELTYIHQSGDTISSSDGGDRYTGLDRFGRVIDQWWYDPSTSTTLERLQYGYDPDGNVLYINNLVTSSQSELFHANSSSSGDDATAYDGLNRLTSFARGTLSASSNNGSTLDTVASPTGAQSWSLDAIGNWTADTGGANGDETRTSNADNEIVSSNGTSNESPTYDHNGNMTYDGNGNTYIYDAWNRIVTFKQGTTALENRTYYADRAMGASTDTCEGVITHMYYSSDWQVIEEQSSSGGAAYVVSAQYVWGQGYTDQLVERDDNSSSGSLGLSGSGLGRRIFAVQDVNHDVTALVNTSASVLDRFTYAPYGTYTPNSYGWLYQFQGGRVDPVSGLYNFRNRDYNAGLGVWMEQDPSGYPDGLDSYEMLQSNPVDGDDPTGLEDDRAKFAKVAVAKLNSAVENASNHAFTKWGANIGNGGAQCKTFHGDGYLEVSFGLVEVAQVPFDVGVGMKGTLFIHPQPRKDGASRAGFWADAQFGVYAYAETSTDIKKTAGGKVNADFEWEKPGEGAPGAVAQEGNQKVDGKWHGQLFINVTATGAVLIAQGTASFTVNLDLDDWGKTNFKSNFEVGLRKTTLKKLISQPGVFSLKATGGAQWDRYYNLPPWAYYEGHQ